jgi:hypothetical protein
VHAGCAYSKNHSPQPQRRLVNGRHFHRSGIAVMYM